MANFAFVSSFTTPLARPAPRTLASRARPTSAPVSMSLPSPSSLARSAASAVTSSASRLAAVLPDPRRALTLAAIALLVVSSVPAQSMAASSGGRVGGSSYRSAPSGGGGSGGSYRGGGVGMGPTIYSPVVPVMPVTPFYYTPFYSGYGFGGGLFLLAAIAMAAVAVTSRIGGAIGDAVSDDSDFYDPTNTVSVVKVGLLANAREIQERLDALGRTADTNTAEGLSYILQETTLALIRCPDYWSYGSATTKKTSFSAVENDFSQASMEARSKIAEETLTNIGSRKSESSRSISNVEALDAAPSEYIVVTLIVANEGQLKLPKNIRNAEDLRTALTAVGGVGTESLQAVEVLWSPQGINSSLTEAEMLLDNPELKRI